MRSSEQNKMVIDVLLRVWEELWEELISDVSLRVSEHGLDLLIEVMDDCLQFFSFTPMKLHLLQCDNLCTVSQLTIKAPCIVHYLLCTHMYVLCKCILNAYQQPE